MSYLDHCDISSLRGRFVYSSATGLIVRISTGRAVGTQSGRGYLVVSLGKRKMRAHRLAWALFYGEHPPEEIDHVNRDRADNRIENLRSATRAQNQANTPIRPYNGTGFKGVTFNRRRGKYRAQIHRAGKQIHLGTFDDPHAAQQAYQAAATEIYGEFARISP